MKKIIYIIILIFVSLFLVACGGIGKGNGMITSSNGEKQYKNEDGEFVRNEWVEIKGNKYYFDMNGFLVTDKWVNNEYYVDTNGKMKIKEWYKDEKDGKIYYLGSNGKYIRDTLITIEDKDYYFEKDGSMIIDKIFESDFEDENGNKKKMYANENGIINKSNDVVMIKENGYFIDSEGFVYTDGWKEVNKSWYYFMSDGKMKKNEWFQATYYFDENGKMLTNAKSPEGYEVDNEGKVLEKYKKFLAADDFQYLFETYCKFPWAEIASDGSYISLDSNPFDFDATDYSKLSKLYLTDVTDAIKEINKIVGFSEYTFKKMSNTTSLDGKQLEETDKIKVEWKYHPNKGIEVIYSKK